MKLGKLPIETSCMQRQCEQGATSNSDQHSTQHLETRSYIAVCDIRQGRTDNRIQRKWYITTILKNPKYISRTKYIRKNNQTSINQQDIRLCKFICSLCSLSVYLQIYIET